MRFNCEFEHPKTGTHKSVEVTLTADECAQIIDARERDGIDQAVIVAQALALRCAYSANPELRKGFLHTEPPSAVAVN